MPHLHDSENIDSVRYEIQAVAPEAPTAGHFQHYTLAGGFYYKDESNNELKIAASAGGMADAVVVAPGSSPRNIIQPSGDFIPIVAKGHASQTVSLFEARNSADAVKVSIGFDGKTEIARGTTTSAAASLNVSETYAPTSGAGSNIATAFQLEFTDDRRTASLSNQVFRFTYTRAATATGVPGAGYDALLNITPIINASLAAVMVGILFEGVTIAAAQTLNDWKAIVIGDGAGSGAITNQYGLYVNSLAKGSTLNYAIYTNTGLVRLGDQLSVVGSADRIQAIFKANGTQTTNLIELQNSSGAVQLAIAGNGRDFVLDTTTGTKWGTASSQKQAWWGAAPVVRPAAYTQNYTTTSRTVNAYTSDTESVAYTGAADGEAKLVDLNALRVAYENLRGMAENLLNVVTQLIDDDQLTGFRG